MKMFSLLITRRLRRKFPCTFRKINLPNIVAIVGNNIAPQNTRVNLISRAACVSIGNKEGRLLDGSSLYYNFS